MCIADTERLLMLQSLMLHMPVSGEPKDIPMRVMIDGLSPLARVPARILRVAGRGVMIDFIRGWKALRVDDNGFVVQVGFQGVLLDIGGGWPSISYAESSGTPILKSPEQPRVARGLLGIDGNVFLTNFQCWR